MPPPLVLLLIHHVPLWALLDGAASCCTALAHGMAPPPFVLGVPCAEVAVKHHHLVYCGLWNSPGSPVASMPSHPATSFTGMANAHRFNHMKADNARLGKLLTAVATCARSSLSECPLQRLNAVQLHSCVSPHHVFQPDFRHMSKDCATLALESTSLWLQNREHEFRITC